VVRFRFYKLLSDQNAIFVIPAASAVLAKKEIQSNGCKVTSVAFLGWYYVGIDKIEQGIRFNIKIGNQQIYMGVQSLGYSYLYENLFSHRPKNNESKQSEC
jgi:hypothetical protein